MTDLNVLRIFIAAAELGSFSAAAARLNLTRSAIAKAIARLEQSTDTRLFHRTTRIITLTDEGRVLLERCAKTIEDLEDALEDMSSRRNEPRGILRVALPDAFGRSVVMPVLCKYLDRWPRVDAEVSFSDRTVDFLADGFDLAVRLGGQNINEDLVSRVIARQRLSFCASPSYVEKYGLPRTLVEIQQHRGIHFSQRGKLLPWRLKNERGEQIQIETPGRIRLDAGEALRDAAVAGFGIAQLPEFLIRRNVEEGKLVRICEEFEPELMPVLVLYPTRKFMSPKVRHFIDSLVEARI
ncbi:transcriptional regulator [Erwinia typographi]|uniref:Transcriptional regulator n=2 Tax=Erwinia typographi TaxID=371042 RepID=A0A0A3ZDD7_9GAMM|nr:transcriptional regulator [Erwinia typographi]